MKVNDMVSVTWWIWGHDPIEKLVFWYEVGRGTIPAQKANHGRGPHHGPAVVLSGKEMLVSRAQPRPWSPPRAGRGWLWKENVVCWNLTTGVVATRGWPWSRPRAWCQPGAGRGCLCFQFVEFCFLNRGRGYHHGLAVADSVCDIVMFMPRVLIPYARFRMKNDLALEWDV